jgi:AcrR family transcriptional regulator
VLEAARTEFAESGYAAATVKRIADRADVALQTLYSAWGSKRALLRAVMETAVTGSDEQFDPDRQPRALFAGATDDGVDDPAAYLAGVAHRFRLLSERAATGWLTYRDAAGTDPGVTEDWQQLQQIRRDDFHLLVGELSADVLRPGLTPASAADTAWVIASPESYDLLVRRAGWGLDEFEEWVAATLVAALLPDS